MMNEHPPLAAELGNWINSQRKLARALLDSQAALAEALRAGATELIESESGVQAELLRALESARPGLAAILRQAAFPDDARGIQRALEQTEGRLGELLRMTWQALRQDLEQIRERNQANSAMAGRHQQAIVRSLMVLNGQGPAQPTGYGPSGTSAPSGLSRRIGIA